MLRLRNKGALPPAFQASPGIFFAKRSKVLLTLMLLDEDTVQAGTPMTVPEEARMSFGSGRDWFLPVSFGLKYPRRRH